MPLPGLWQTVAWEAAGFILAIPNIDLMAKQTGDVKITVTINGITFYEQLGNFEAKKKSSIDGKRIKTDPAFEAIRQSSGILSRASRLASALYKTLPPGSREKGMFNRLTGDVYLKLKAGLAESDISLWFQHLYGSEK